MPAPQASLYKQLARQLFIANAIRLPVSWSQPNNQFSDAFDPSDLIKIPNLPTNLFREATLNKFHVDTAKQVSDQFGEFIDGTCDAICSGISTWLTSASIAGVVINAVVGILTPGGVVGPPLTPLILAQAPKKTPQQTKYSNVIATVFGTAWLQWQSGITGQLLYPAFAAVPSPVAPPIPNIPVPLIAFPSPGEVALSGAVLKGQMIAQLADPQAPHSAELFDAIANGFTTPFSIFKASTMVTNVLGTGPVPTFAPPFVPVGPVIGGVGTGPPGCLV
jgi:hypothetical protein